MKSTILGSALLIMALSACGGGGSAPAVIPTVQPVTATFASTASSRTVYEPILITGQTMSLAAPVPVYNVGTAIYSFASEPGESLPAASPLVGTAQSAIIPAAIFATSQPSTGVPSYVINGKSAIVCGWGSSLAISGVTEINYFWCEGNPFLT